MRSEKDSTPAAIEEMFSGKSYVDNASNRRLGRVGLPHGSAVVSRSSSRASRAESPPSSPFSRSGCGTYVDNTSNRKLGRVGMEYGTAVVSRSSRNTSVASNRDSITYGDDYPSYSSCGGASRSSSGTYVDNTSNRKLGRVGMEYGTAVVSRSSRNTSVASNRDSITYGDDYPSYSSCGGASRSSSGTYVDNTSNRKLGRVGMEHGTAVVSRSSKNTSVASNRDSIIYGDDYPSYSSCGRESRSSSGTYVDNTSNRKLGRVGMEYGTAVVSKSSNKSSVASSTDFTTYVDDYRSSIRGASRTGSETNVDNSHNGRLDHVGMVTAVASKPSRKPSASSTAPKVYITNNQNCKLNIVEPSILEPRSATLLPATPRPIPLVPAVFRPIPSVPATGFPVFPVEPVYEACSSINYCSSKPVVCKASDAPSRYVENAYNRRLGRVGMLKETHMIYQDEKAFIDGNGIYVSSKAIQRKQKIVNAIDSLPLDEMKHLKLDDPTAYDTKEACTASRILRVEEIEENWKKSKIMPQTDVSKIKDIAKNYISKSDLTNLKLIGEGGFGVVYAGLWKTTKTPVAYKALARKCFTQKKIRSFVKEIEIFSKLEHKNIVKMFGAVVEKEDIGIVMEYCKKTLFDALFVYEEDKLRPPDKLRIIGEVGSALEYLHTHEPPIAHCDVKSQNILMESNATAKLCDFGLSVIKNTITSSRSTRGEDDAPPGQGTPRYSAPEVLRGELLKLEALMVADIYSLSLVVYEVVLEEEPYELLSPKQLTKNVGYGDLRPSLEEVQNSDLKVLLQKCWNKIPKKRPGIKQFNEEWEKIKELP